jgi:hypothetical protein
LPRSARIGGFLASGQLRPAAVPAAQIRLKGSRIMSKISELRIAVLSHPTGSFLVGALVLLAMSFISRKRQARIKPYAGPTSGWGSAKTVGAGSTPNIGKHYIPEANQNALSSNNS